MRVIIAGSRTITNYNLLEAVIEDSGFKIEIVISGHARGVDMLGERWAKKHDLPVLICPARWDLYGKEAGFKRNQQMVDEADAVIVLWDGKSKGTRDTLMRSFTKKIPIYRAVYQVEKYNILDGNSDGLF